MLTTQISLDMQDDDSQRLLDFLKCRHCGDFAQEAMETSCCHALLCTGCLEKLDSRCPECQAACSAAPSHLGRRLVGTQPWQCPGCGKATSQSEQADHGLVCPNTERRCPAEGCAFRGLPDGFLVHLMEAHKGQLLRRPECLFESARASHHRGSCVSAESLEFSSASTDSLQRRLRLFSLLRDRRDNSRTNPTVTGKNYCSRPLNGPSCVCCDGFCGPNNGCNCVDCMRQDLLRFSVRTPRTLVNREGAVARISGETGRFYCGRQVMEHDPTTDGCCGPDNGNNCHACGKLDEQLFSRYADIAADWGDDDESRDVVDIHDAIGMAYDTID